MPSTALILQAEGINLAIEKLTGEKAYIQYSPSGADLYFTPDQVQRARPFFTAILEKKPSGTDNINIHAEPIVAPIILKKAAPYIIGLVIVGYILGKL